jgi:hypothetical protein
MRDYTGKYIWNSQIRYNPPVGLPTPPPMGKLGSGANLAGNNLIPAAHPANEVTIEAFKLGRKEKENSSKKDPSFLGKPPAAE